MLRFDTELRTFCEQLYAPLVGALSLYCASADVAEDLAQETFARVCANWRRVKKMDHPEAWTFKVASNLAKSLFRRKHLEKRTLDRVTAERAVDEVNGPSFDGPVLREAIRALPSRQKEALVLRYYLDLPFKEVALWMDVPEATAKSLVRRAVDRLRRSDLLAERRSLHV